MSSKYVVLSIVFIVFYWLFATISMAKVIELGEAEVRGQKAQPEAMTFISRARMQDDVVIPLYKRVSDKIQTAIDDKIFRISGEQ